MRRASSSRRWATSRRSRRRRRCSPAPKQPPCSEGPSPLAAARASAPRLGHVLTRQTPPNRPASSDRISDRTTPCAPSTTRGGGPSGICSRPTGEGSTTPVPPISGYPPWPGARCKSAIPRTVVSLSSILHVRAARWGTPSPCRPRARAAGGPRSRPTSRPAGARILNRHRPGRRRSGRARSAPSPQPPSPRGCCRRAHDAAQPAPAPGHRPAQALLLLLDARRASPERRPRAELAVTLARVRSIPFDSRSSSVPSPFKSSHRIGQNPCPASRREARRPADLQGISASRMSRPTPGPHPPGLACPSVKQESNERSRIRTSAARRLEGIGSCGGCPPRSLGSGP